MGIVASITAFFVSLGVKATIAASIAKLVVTVAVNVALQAVSRAFRKKPRVNDPSVNAEQTVQRRLSMNNPLEVLVGRRVVGGVTLNEDSYGLQLEYAVAVIAISSKPCTAFHQLYLDGIAVTLSGDPTVAEATVTSHFLGKNNATRAKARMFLGDASGTVESLGSEIFTNPNFDTDITDWSNISGGTIAYDNGTILATCPDADTNAGFSQNVALEVGEIYELSVDITQASFDWRIDLFGGGHSALIFAQDETGIGVQTYRFTADATSTNVRVFCSNDGASGPNTINVTSMSLKKVSVTTAPGVGDYLATKFGSDYSASDIHGDYCILVIECRNTNDDLDTATGENFIPFQGFPDVKVEVSGAKVCDPRIPGSTYDDESTYVYSNNPALIDSQYDYGWYSGVGAGRVKIVGYGYPETIMNEAQTISNANYCDNESFTCAGLLRSNQGADIQEVRKAYNAVRVEDAATVYCVAEGNRANAGVLDMGLYPSAFVSALDRDGMSTEVYNEVFTKYVEPSEVYGEKEMPVYSKAEWIAADNHIPRQMPFVLNMVTNLEQAAKLEKQEVYTSRAASTAAISDLPYSFIGYKVGDYVTITNSDIEYMNNKEWVIDGRGNNDRGDVSLALRLRPDAEAFAFDPATETPDVQIQSPDTPTWEAIFFPGGSPFDPNNVGVSSELLEQAAVTSTLSQATDLNQIAYATNEGLTATSSGTLVRIRSASTGPLTTPSVTVTPMGGAEPYTFSWVKESGSDVTIDDALLATTTFTVDPGLDGLRSGVYRCDITDSSVTPLTFSAYIAVVISNG